MELYLGQVMVFEQISIQCLKAEKKASDMTRLSCGLLLIYKKNPSTIPKHVCGNCTVSAIKFSMGGLKKEIEKLILTLLCYAMI